MAGPANQAAANVQALAETLQGAAGSTDNSHPHVTYADALAAITADDWTVATGEYNEFVYDAADPTWDALFADVPSNVASPVFYNRSGPLAAPYGGGWDEDQFA